MADTNTGKDFIGDDFEGIENEVSDSRYPKITPGKYKLAVSTLKAIKSRKGERFAIGEFDILESSGPEALPVGSKTTHMIKLGQDLSRKNVQSLVAAVLNENPKTIMGSTAKELFINPPAEVTGVTVSANAYTISTKKNTPFTVVEYAAAP